MLWVGTAKLYSVSEEYLVSAYLWVSMLIDGDCVYLAVLLKNVYAFCCGIFLFGGAWGLEIGERIRIRWTAKRVKNWAVVFVKDRS
jgi:hypothetical protein